MFALYECIYCKLNAMLVLGASCSLHNIIISDPAGRDDLCVKGNHICQRCHGS